MTQRDNDLKALAKGKEVEQSKIIEAERRGVKMGYVKDVEHPRCVKLAEIK